MTKPLTAEGLRTMIDQAGGCWRLGFHMKKAEKRIKEVLRDYTMFSGDDSHYSILIDTVPVEIGVHPQWLLKVE